MPCIQEGDDQEWRVSAICCPCPNRRVRATPPSSLGDNKNPAEDAAHNLKILPVIIPRQLSWEWCGRMEGKKGIGVILISNIRRNFYQQPAPRDRRGTRKRHLIRTRAAFAAICVRGTQVHWAESGQVLVQWGPQFLSHRNLSTQRRHHGSNRPKYSDEVPRTVDVNYQSVSDCDRQGRGRRTTMPGGAASSDGFGS